MDVKFFEPEGSIPLFPEPATGSDDASNKALLFATTQVEQYEKNNPGHPNATAGVDMKAIHFEMSTAYKTKALIHEKMGYDSLAEQYFIKTINERLVSVVNDDFGQVAGDYNDFGNFYLNTVGSFKKANACYLKTLEYAKKAED